MRSSIKAFFAFFLSRKKEVVGQSGLEPPTSRLSVVCSNQLSYWPASFPALYGAPAKAVFSFCGGKEEVTCGCVAFAIRRKRNETGFF